MNLRFAQSANCHALFTQFYIALTEKRERLAFPESKPAARLRKRFRILAVCPSCLIGITDIIKEPIANNKYSKRARVSQ